MKRRRKSESETNDQIGHEVNEPKLSNAKNSKCRTFLAAFFISILLGILLLILSANSFFKFDIELNNIKSDILFLYEKYDRNGDGLLDLGEFEPIGHKLLSVKVIILKRKIFFLNIHSLKLRLQFYLNQL